MANYCFIALQCKQYPKLLDESPHLKNCPAPTQTVHADKSTLEGAAPLLVEPSSIVVRSSSGLGLVYSAAFVVHTNCVHAESEQRKVLARLRRGRQDKGFPRSKSCFLFPTCQVALSL